MPPVAEIALPQTVFLDAALLPAAVNLFCGKNGTGKSTLAGCFRTQRRLRYANPVQKPQISIFDAGYVQQQLRQHANLAGIVTVSRADAETASQLADLKRRKLLAEAELREVLKDTEPLRAESDAVYAEYAEAVWRRSAGLRARYPLAVRGGSSSTKFAKALRYSSPHYSDTARLDRMYRLAFGDDAVIFPLLHGIPDTGTLDRLAEDPLLDEVFFSSGGSQFQQFLTKLGAAEWVQQGMTEFSGGADGLCPYCQQPLPADFSARLTACFDDTYRQCLARLDALERAYRQAANAAVQALRQPETRCPYADYHRYDADAALLRTLLRENLDAIRGKRQKPAEPAVLTGVRELMERINRETDTINRVIARCNLYVTDRAAMQDKCTRSVMSFLAYRLSDETEAMQRALCARAAWLPTLEQKADTLRAKIAFCNAETARLSALAGNTAPAAEQINRLLREADFTGFSLRESEKHPHAYEIVRPDGQHAAALSEGERRLLAFLYFYVSVQTPVQSGRVLVLDDPYTALDSDAAEIVQRLTRELCGQCGKTHTGIRQIFVLTCRQRFFRELQLDLPDSAAAFILRRRNGRTVTEKA